MDKNILIALSIAVAVSLVANVYQFSEIQAQNKIISDQQDTLMQAQAALLQAKDLIDSLATPSSGKADLNSKYNAFVTLKDKLGNVKYYSESHNLVTNLGVNYSAACIGNGVCSAAFNYIAVGGNTSAQAATDTTLANEFSTCGLGRATGTVTLTGTGTWTLTKVFSVTNTCTNINSTGIFNATSGNTLLAEAPFTSTNVANGDSLNITWTGSQTGS